MIGVSTLGDNFVIERILELCDKKNMSQYELSQRAGLTQSSISTLMSRGSLPKITTLQKICDGFGITLAQFFTQDDKKIPDLSEEQYKMLALWESLSPKEKIALEHIINSIIEMR